MPNVTLDAAILDDPVVIEGKVTPSTRRFPQPWRSPEGQPGWARPILLLLALAAAVVYAWGISQNPLHSYYAPAVKSMSESWKALLFGAYDPQASITLDKLSGALVVQALSARIFGYHVWSVIAPQVAEAVITVLVLYRSVRRWLNPAAGLLAAAAYATMPIVAALARSEISDTLLVLLLVCAADAWTGAMLSGKARGLVLAGIFIGLAFQAKMVQAWGIVPALALGYLVAAPVALRTRLVRLGLTGLVTGVVSFAWIGLLTVLPASARPYVDGSPSNSALYMVFQYNLLGRYDAASGGSTPGTEGGWTYLFSQSVATQVGWLYPMAIVGLIAGLVLCARRPRTDLVRAGYLMWAVWLATHVVAFALGRVAHSYYVVAVAPALAALAGGGAVTLWRWFRDSHGWRPFALPAATGMTLMWTVYLSSSYSSFRPWVSSTVLAVGGLSIMIMIVQLVIRGAIAEQGVENSPSTLWTRQLSRAGSALAVLSVLIAPTVWATSTVNSDYAGSSHGPAAGPSSSGRTGTGFSSGRSSSSGTSGSSGSVSGMDISDEPADQVLAAVTYLSAHDPGSDYVLAVQGSTLAGQYLMTGVSVLPMGGYSGDTPFPSVDQLTKLIESRKLRYVLLGSGQSKSGTGRSSGDDSDSDTTLYSWVTENCSTIDADGTEVYDCGS